MDVYLASNSSLLFLLKARQCPFEWCILVIIFRMLVLTKWVGNLKLRKEVTDLVAREITAVEFSDPNGLL